MAIVLPAPLRPGSTWSARERRGDPKAGTQFSGPADRPHAFDFTTIPHRLHVSRERRPRAAGGVAARGAVPNPSSPAPDPLDTRRIVPRAGRIAVGTPGQDGCVMFGRESVAGKPRPDVGSDAIPVAPPLSICGVGFAPPLVTRCASRTTPRAVSLLCGRSGDRPGAAQRTMGRAVNSAAMVSHTVRLPISADTHTSRVHDTRGECS